MRKKYLAISLALALMPLAASAQDATTNSSVETNTGTRPVKVETRIETRVKANADLRAQNEARKLELEAQRERMKAAAEERKAAAQRLGDEAKAKREALKVEREEKREEIDAKREAKRVELEAKRAEVKEKRTEIRKDVAEKKAAHTARVMSATAERLEKIIARIESRIEKVKSRGGDTSESERLIALAKTNIADAKVSISAFASIDLSGETIQENFERIRTLAAEAREHLRAAHENMLLAVRALNSVEVDASVDSSITQ